MDVGDPSNLERIRWMYDDDVSRLRRDVTGVASDDSETRACIAAVRRSTGCVLDPHTAVAWTAMGKIRPRMDSAAPWVVLATAHPAKFPEVVEEATGTHVTPPDALAATFERTEVMTSIDASPRALADLLMDGAVA
jgi:threonine synthase